MGRAAAGVGGIGLREEDEVVDMAVLDPSQEGVTLLTACSNGFGKRTRFQDYRRQKRNGSGIISIKTSERNGPVVGLKAVREDDDVVLMSREGLVMRMKAADISLMGRATQGVKMMNLKKGDALASLEQVAQAEDVEDVEAVEGGSEQDAGNGESVSSE
jgi:DNA gyrase subunit A